MRPSAQGLLSLLEEHDRSTLRGLITSLEQKLEAFSIPANQTEQAKRGILASWVELVELLSLDPVHTQAEVLSAEVLAPVSFMEIKVSGNS